MRQCARRMRIFDLVLRRLGTAMGFSRLAQLLAQGIELRPAWVGFLLEAVAAPHIETAAAPRAEAGALRPAQWMQRQGQGQRIPKHWLEIDLVALDPVGLVLHRLLVPGAGKQLAYLEVHLRGELVQAPSTRQ